MTVQDDVYSGTVLEQTCVIEYVIVNVQVRHHRLVQQLFTPLKLFVGGVC